MIAPDRENAEAAEQIEIAAAVTVVELLPLPFAEADVVADRPQNPHHLFIEMAAVQPVTVSLAFGKQPGDVVPHARRSTLGFWFRFSTERQQR
jgi:hypothetical protein